MSVVAQHCCGLYTQQMRFRGVNTCYPQLLAYRPARRTAHVQTDRAACTHSRPQAVTCSIARRQLSKASQSPGSTADLASTSSQHSGLGKSAAVLLAACMAQQPNAHAEEAAAAASGATPTDWIIQGAFVLAITALAVVTGGVLYLAVTSFLDKRTEDEERKKFEAAQKDRELQQAMGGAKAPKRKRTADELTRGGGRGFGR